MLTQIALIVSNVPLSVWGCSRVLVITIHLSFCSQGLIKMVDGRYQYLHYLLLVSSLDIWIFIYFFVVLTCNILFYS